MNHDAGGTSPRARKGMMMHKRFIQSTVSAAAALLVLATAPGANAKSDVPLPADLETPTAPGVSKLELDGDNIHNCGNVLLHITNFGLIGSQPGSNRRYSGAPSAQWPKGSPTEYLWSAGLWVGANKDGEPHVSTGQFAVEFRPGRTDLDQIYQTRELAVGGGRLPSPNADDDRDGQTNEDWLDGRDNDNDGAIDEDFAAISNQMFFCEYNDYDSNIRPANPEHVPLEILVQQSSLCWESPLTDDFIAFDFKIINQGINPLEQVCVGLLADCDIGPREADDVAEDDYAGFWEGIRNTPVGNTFKNVKISMGYMWDDDGDESLSEGYVGLMFLGAKDPASDGIPRTVSLRNFRFFSGRASFEAGGDPNDDAERYRVLDGTAPKSLPPANPETGLRETQPAKRKDDYRMVVSAGPFETVDAGDTLEFQAAIVVGRFFEGMLANAIQAQLTYDGAYLDCDDNPQTGQLGRETPVCGPLAVGFQRYDACDSTCDFNPMEEQCGANVPIDGCIYINADCELEEQTGFETGVDGKECLIHWLIGTAPPPPRMRLVAREGQVDVLWDNLSETTPDLRLSVIDFESYRVWRADNWTRPFGTTVNTGPGGELWQLLAEFDLPRNGIGSDTGLESVRYQPAIPDQAVEFYREWFREHPFQEPPKLPGYSDDQIDSAQSLAKGVRYYRFTDPPFLRERITAGPCPSNGRCPLIQHTGGQLYNARCNRDGVCQATSPPPHSGAHYFYGVTATDHKLEADPMTGQLVIAGPGLAGDPSSNFLFINPPTNALPADASEDLAKEEIYVVPNPATPNSMRDWTLSPNNDDPTGIKVEFHHLPRSTGKVTIFSLAGDMVEELPFDASGGNGSLQWDLVSRNGQDVTSGVYLFAVEADDARFKRFVGKFVVIR